MTQFIRVKKHILSQYKGYRETMIRNSLKKFSSLILKRKAIVYCPLAQRANDVKVTNLQFLSFKHDILITKVTTTIVSITACLAHPPKKCTQSGNFQFDIKSLSDFKILYARIRFFKNTSLISLQQVFTVASATSCVNIFIESF